MSLQSLLKKMNVLAKTNVLEKRVAVTMLQVTNERIFTKGQAANGSQIGKYSAGYVKQRQKDNYPSSNKVILQATTQMINDWSVVPSGKSVGLGFKNSFNAEKSEYVENAYKKAIFEHTNAELDILDETINEELTKILNG